MARFSIDLTGKKQGRLTILRKIDAPKHHEGHTYLCGCYCGNLVTYRTGQLNHKVNPRKSCGSCKDADKYPGEYSIYTSMLQRCRNPNNSRYLSYGGRGIEVCNRWRYDFLFFLEDVGLRPTSVHSLDRINVDGNYEPSNCKWSTPTEQNLNKRKTYYYEQIKYLIDSIVRESKSSSESIESIADRNLRDFRTR